MVVLVASARELMWPRPMSCAPGIGCCIADGDCACGVNEACRVCRPGPSLASEATPWSSSKP